MLEKTLRQRYQRWFVNPIAKRIHSMVTPLQITLLSLIFGILVAPALIFNFNLTAILFLFISGYLDTLDGTIARHTHQTTPLGSVFDIMADRMVEFAVIFGLWLVHPSERALMCILMLGSILLCITSFLVVGIFTNNNSEKSFHYSEGLIERAEAFIFFTLMILLPTYFNYLAILFVILVLITTAIRLYEFKKFQNL